KSRALLARIDGVCILTCRPYGDSSEIVRPLAEIRGLGDAYLAFPHVPARVIPVILSDIKHAMAGRAAPSATGDWVDLVRPDPNLDPRNVAGQLATIGDRTMDCMFRLVRNWSLDLTLDLEIGGLVVAHGPRGELLPRLALRRRSRGG